MTTTLLIILAAALYVGVLFAIAWWGDRQAERERSFWNHPTVPTIVYCLTLTIYNTSWSFFGSVGRAAKTGWDFMPIYIAPAFVLIACQPMLRRLIERAKAQNATSIADFLAARYGKSQTLAAIVTVASLAALLPYIALQLKAVTLGFDALTDNALATEGSLPPWRDTTLWIVLGMAAFVVTFGVRHSHATGRHRGLMLAVAFEGVVKIVAFIAVGLFILFGMFDGPDAILAQAFRTMPDRTIALLIPDFTVPAWYWNTLTALFAFLCLPHLFQTMIVENDRPSDLRAARLFFPLYLLVFSLFMLPIALAGILTFGSSASGDSFMLALPIAAGAPGVALMSFIGGLSAATGMVIVALLSLSTMLCNDVVMPLLLRAGLVGGDVSRVLIRVRRIAVVAILLLAYGMHRLVGSAYALTEIGLVSFVAVAQFGPALVAALYWRRATWAGAVGGILIGIAIWAMTLLLPGGITPPAGLDAISYSTLLSLSANVVVFIGASLWGGRSRDASPSPTDAERVRIADLRTLAIRFVGAVAGREAFDAYLATRAEGQAALDAPADLAASRFTENLLAGAIGAASARVVMTATLAADDLTHTAARRALDQASEALRENHKLLLGTLEGVSQGICTFDAELRMLAWNERFRSLLALPEGFVKRGLPLAEMVAFNRERQEYDAHVIPALPVNRDLARQSWPYTYERQRPDGTMLEITFDRMPDGGYVSTYTDISERHRNAEALRIAKATLEQRVTERTEALHRAKTEAETANAGKTRFIAAASHDLLQPMNAARLFMGALEERLAAHGDPRDQRLARDASAALHSTESLIETLLEISSLDGAGVRPNIGRVSLSELFRPLRSEFTALAAERGIRLDVVESAACVRSDPVLLRRVLQNLLSNAVRHTERGRVLLGCRVTKDSVRIEVHDTGPGIPAHQHQAIFGEFYRIGRAGGTQGVGLGLAIVARIATLLDHRIEVRSTPGKGSCFSITLTRECAAVSVTSVSAGHRVVDEGRLDILCVDNDPAILAGLEALLGGWGHRILLHDGRAGAPPPAPDLMLVDYHLDDAADGLTRVEGWRRTWACEVPAILITADRSPEIRARAAALGIAVLPKPVQPAVLRRAVGGVARRLVSVA